MVTSDEEDHEDAAGLLLLLSSSRGEFHSCCCCCIICCCSVILKASSFSECKVFNVLRSGIFFISSWRISGWPGWFWLTTICRADLSLLCIFSINSVLRSPGLSVAMTTMEQNRPISASDRHKAFMRSAKSNMESIKNRALELLCIESRFNTCPFKQIMLAVWESNIHARRTSNTSNTPAFRRVTWSSCASREKPGMRLANSTTPRMAGENLFEKSCKSSCWPVSGCGLGFKGHACNKKNIYLVFSRYYA